jgi:hypothetical protein
MTEEAECVKMYALFRQLSAPQKREILKKVEALAAAEVRETVKEERERRVHKKHRAT